MSWASRHNLLARAVNQSLGGVPVTWGAVSATAILEQNTEMVLGDQVLSVEYALHNLPADLFGLLAYGDVVTVNGDPYEVRHAPMSVGDGMYCIVALSKLAPDNIPTPQQPVAEVRIDSDTIGVIYVGRAIYGASESAPVWTIVRTTYDAAGVRQSKGTATGVTWSGRASASYA